jgi:hypothetical protein
MSGARLVQRKHTIYSDLAGEKKLLPR